MNEDFYKVTGVVFAGSMLIILALFFVSEHEAQRRHTEVIQAIKEASK